jgi:gliding motility-associated-like protein
MITQITKSLSLFLILSFFSLTINAQSIGGTTTTNGPTSYCSATNSGYVSVIGYKSTILFWQSSTDGGVTWNNNANQLPNQTYFNLAQTTCFRAVVQDGAFTPDTSTQICITIYQPAVAGTVVGGGIFCASSGSGTLTVIGNTGTVAYWQYSDTNGGSWINIPNSTTTENYSGLTKSRLYRVIVQNGPTCKKDTSKNASFIVAPPTVAGTISGATTVCAAANAGVLSITGNMGMVTGWQSSVNNGTSWQNINNITTSLSYLNLSITTWYRAIVKSGICSPDTTAHVVINVNPVTVPGILTGGGNFCGNTATGTLTLSGTTGVIQNWLSSTDNGTTWISIPNTTNSQNYTNVPVTTWYSVVVKSGTCPADTSVVEKVNVAPQTVSGTISSSNSVCYGIGRDTLLLTGRVGKVLNWLQSTDNGGTWTTITNQTDSLIYNALTQTTWYAAVVQSGNCAIDTATAVAITVFPKTPVDAGPDATLTLGQSVTLAGTGTGTPLWTPALFLSNPAIFTPVAKPETTTTYTLFVTDSKGCVNSDTVRITILKVVFDGKISNLFTPNGDGINDTWYLEDIQKFPDCEVIVYNIYGNVVFTKKGYMNDWKGTYNGVELPDGTYYYVLKFDSSDVVLKGALDILRNK